MIAALVPVVYCGGLVYYFLGVGGSFDGVAAIGLGPTVVGLSAVGLLFCIPLFVKIVRIFSGGPRFLGLSMRGGADASAHERDGTFDADAVLARYMARTSAEAAAGAPAASNANGGAKPATHPGFGRKV